MPVVIDHVDNFAKEENIHRAGHCIVLDHDHGHPYVFEEDNDVMVVMVNVDVFAGMEMGLDDFDHWISVEADHEQEHRRFLSHRLVHLPYIYMLVQHHWL